MTYYSHLKSPLGDLLLTANATELTGIYFQERHHAPKIQKDWVRDSSHAVLREAAKQLREYFAGTRSSFTLPLQVSGTAFQEKIWRQIARIPYAKTISYSDLAKRAGSPKAVRPAGGNTGKNPISIVIPCHRVMGKDGSITGYAGGVDRKQYLLDLEKRAFAPR